jgi:hypothetical protein
VVFLLAASPAWPQPIGVAERTVELVLAHSEHQARVVERAMRTGFFVDQLRIPQTSYLGRFPWAEVNPSVQKSLQAARPNEPYLLEGTLGKLLVARVLPTGPPALLGEKEYAEDRERTWALLSMGLTDPGLLSFEVDVDTEDLAAICRSKKRLNDDLLRRARAKVDALPEGAPFQELVPTYATLVGMLALRGEMVEAIQAVDALGQQQPFQVQEGQRSPRDLLNRFLGILELRRGEVENCLHHHHREMCLFPLSEAARHRLDDGARRTTGVRAFLQLPRETTGRSRSSMATQHRGDDTRELPRRGTGALPHRARGLHLGG